MNLEKYLMEKADRNQTPLYGTFELSPVCNLSCSMCYVRKDMEDVTKEGGLKSVDQWLEIARQAKEAGNLYLLLTGGEPFIFPDFFQLYEELIQMGMILSINTNGTIINADMVRHFVAKPPKQISVTLYGSSSEEYRNLCGDGSAYERAREGVLRLKKAGIDLVVNVSVTPENVEHIWETYDFCKKYDIHLKNNVYMFPPLRVSKKQKETFSRLTPVQAAEHMARWKYTSMNKEERMEHQELVNAVMYMEEHPVQENYPLMCRAGKSSFWINWKGEMTPCGMLPNPVYNVFEMGFFTAWEKVKEAITCMDGSPKCGRCPKKMFCYGCAAASKTETGSVEGTPEYLCEFAQEYMMQVMNWRLEKE